MTCTISFLPVGNADSIVIQTDNSMIVVDLGNLSVLEEWIEQHQIAKIDRIYITHAHGDHFPSLIKLTTFIDDYQSKIKIEKIHLPYKVIELAEQKLLRFYQTCEVKISQKSYCERISAKLMMIYSYC